MAQKIEQVGVLGAGLMGHGIAQVAAQAGYAVVLREVDEATLAKGIGKIEKQLARAVEKGKSSLQDADAVRARITGTTDYRDLADCDLVIEAITESLPLKLEMWNEIDAIVKPEAIFATNTSSLSVIDQAAATSRAQQFVGVHYFNPAQVMKLVEVVRCVTTSQETFDTALRVHPLGGQARDPDARQSGVHRQPPAGPVHARRDPRARRAGRLDRGDRRRDEGRRGAPDGAADARGLRRPGHAGLDLRRRSSTSSASAASRSRRRCARCSPRVGTGASRERASTTTPARRRSRTRLCSRGGD